MQEKSKYNRNVKRMKKKISSIQAVLLEQIFPVNRQIFISKHAS